MTSSHFSQQMASDDFDAELDWESLVAAAHDYWDRAEADAEFEFWQYQTSLP